MADSDHDDFAGPVEVDEAYFGGLEKNKHADKRHNAGRGGVGKTAVVGVKDRQTNFVRAQVVRNLKGVELRSFVNQHAANDAMIYIYEAAAYRPLPRHASVRHGVGECVKGQVHINGMESFWSLLKRGFVGTFHKMSPKHVDRYVDEFAGRHNTRPMDTIEQMRHIARQMEGKRLKYRDLIAPNGLASGARATLLDA